MSSVNKVIILGNLARDLDVRTAASGMKIVNMTVATSERWKDKSGERQEKSEFHRVVIFNERLAEVAEKYLRKGSKVYIEGALQTRKWTDQSGQDRYSTEIVLQRYRGELVLLGDRSGGQERGDAHEPARGEDTSRYGYSAPQQPAGGGGDFDGDSDIPF